jgi:hypothetical protein
MASGPDQTLHDLSRQLPTTAQFEELMQKLEGMDDRAAALILSAIIDNLLEYAIISRFVRLTKTKRDRIFRNPTAPLTSMSAKTTIAHAMGICGDEPRAQLDRIRSIRNTFAHAMLSVSFDDPTIAAECRKLDPQRLLDRGNYRTTNDTPRERFIVAGTFLSMILMKQIDHRADELRYGPRPWHAPSRNKFEWPLPRSSQTQD